MQNMHAASTHSIDKKTLSQCCKISHLDAQGRFTLLYKMWGKYPHVLLEALMFELSWKRAARLSLVLATLSLPVWAMHGKPERHRGGGGGGGNNVPEGGSSLAYAALAGSMIAGGMVLARKSRAL
jgi:hypothetical protein